MTNSFVFFFFWNTCFEECYEKYVKNIKIQLNECFGKRCVFCREIEIIKIPYTKLINFSLCDNLHRDKDKAISFALD